MLRVHRAQIAEAIEAELERAQKRTRVRKIRLNTAIWEVSRRKHDHEQVIIMYGGGVSRRSANASSARSTFLYIAWIDDVAWVHAQRELAPISTRVVDAVSYVDVGHALQYLPKFMRHEIAAVLLRKQGIVMPTNINIKLCRRLQELPNVVLIYDEEHRVHTIATPWVCARVHEPPRLVTEERIIAAFADALHINREIACKILTGQMPVEEIEREMALGVLGG